MPIKSELIEMVSVMSKQQFTKGEVKSFINSVSSRPDEQPSKIKKGDVIYNEMGGKKRPCVVVKVFKDFVFMIPLSTTFDELNLIQSRSRFFKKGWFTKGVAVSKKEYAIQNFMGVYDNPKLLNKAIKLMKEEINSI